MTRVESQNTNLVRQYCKQTLRLQGMV